MKGSKLYEVTFNENGIRIRHNNPHPMTAEQKHSILLALIGSVTLLVALYLVGSVAFSIAGVPLLLFGVYRLLSKSGF